MTNEFRDESQLPEQSGNSDVSKSTSTQGHGRADHLHRYQSADNMARLRKIRQERENRSLPDRVACAKEIFASDPWKPLKHVTAALRGRFGLTLSRDVLMNLRDESIANFNGSPRKNAGSPSRTSEMALRSRALSIEVKRQAVLLHDQGIDASEIAKRIGAETKQVLSWISNRGRYVPRRTSPKNTAHRKFSPGVLINSVGHIRSASNQTYSDEFKADVIRRATGGMESGAQIARSLGISQSLVSAWSRGMSLGRALNHPNVSTVSISDLSVELGKACAREQRALEKVNQLSAQLKEASAELETSRKELASIFAEMQRMVPGLNR